MMGWFKQYIRNIVREELAQDKPVWDSGHSLLAHELRRIDPGNPRLRFVERSRGLRDD